MFGALRLLGIKLMLRRFRRREAWENMAGLKHVEVAQGRVDQACGEIRKLGSGEIEKTLDFIYGVVAQRRPGGDDLGKAERLLERQGTWSFNEGERDALLQELARLRDGGRP
jgi:hypothetical protein